MIEKHGSYFTPVCNGCGEELPTEYDFRDATDAVRRAGWQTVPPEYPGGEWEHYCPDCAGRWLFDD